MNFSWPIGGALVALFTLGTAWAQQPDDFSYYDDGQNTGNVSYSDILSGKASETVSLNSGSYGCANDCGYGGCCPSCCDGYNDCCRPLWTVKAGAVIMERTRPRPGVFIENAITGEPLANFQDFDFGWDGGLDISIIRALGEGGNAVELRYFGIDGWSASETFTTSPLWAIPTDPPLFGTGVADIDAVYTSRIYSTEVNWRRRRSDRIAWLLGFRWIELHENLNVDADFGQNMGDVNFNVDNHLYGGQAGIDWRVFDRGGPFAVDSVFKTGIYGNSADNAFLLTEGVGPPSCSCNFGQQQGQVAFVGEIGVTGVYQWTDYVALRAGYQLLWVEGVAVASDQVTAVDLLDEDGIDTLGGVFYHGALLSVDFMW